MKKRQKTNLCIILLPGTVSEWNEELFLHFSSMVVIRLICQSECFNLAIFLLQLLLQKKEKLQNISFKTFFRLEFKILISYSQDYICVCD